MLNHRYALKIFVLAGLLSAAAPALGQTQSQNHQCLSVSDSPQLCYVYNQAAQTTLVSAPTQKIRLRQDDSTFETDGNFTFSFHGKIEDLQKNPGIAKQYGLIVRGIPLYTRSVTRARFALLNITPKKMAGELAKPLAVTLYAQTPDEKLKSVQTVELVIGDILDLLVMMEAREAEFEFALGSFKLAEADLTNGANLIRYVSGILENQLKEKSTNRIRPPRTFATIQ